LLLKNETLSPLFEIAFAKYDISKLRKKLKRLISGYGSDLASEASSDVQTEVAKFVQGAARRVTIQLTRAMVSEIKYDFISNRRRINKLLESLPANQQTPLNLVEKTSDHPQDPLADSDSDQSEPESDLAPQTLEEVEHFMVVSRAFNTLVGGLRKWLGVLDEDLDESTQINFQRRAIPRSVGWTTVTTQTGQVLLQCPKHLGSSSRLGQTRSRLK
jgi:hypothetical protein